MSWCICRPAIGQTEPTSLEDLLDLQISTAAMHEQSTREAPASVTVITAADIEQRGYVTLADALRDTRSFYLSDDRNYLAVGVRGFGRPADYNNRVLVLINGAPMNEAIWGSVAVGADFGLSMLAVDRIEIVRGPGSALYGTNAMFAVINILTKSGHQQDGLVVDAGLGNDGAKEGRAAWGRSYDNGLDLAIAGQWSDTDGADHYYAESDDPETNDGLAVGRDWERNYGLTGKATIGRLQIQGHVTSRETGVPTGAYETDFNGATETHDEFQTVEARYRRDLGPAAQFELSAAYFHYHYKGMWFYDEFPFLDESHNNSVYSEVRYQRDLRPENRLIVGAEIQRHYNSEYRAWDAEATYFDGGLPFTVVSAYAQDEQQLLSNLALTLGVRADHYSHVGLTINPRAALVYHPRSRQTFKLLYGQAFRAPGMYELDYADEISGFIPNPDLRPERIRTTEVIWEYQITQHAQSVVSVYQHRMRRLIDQFYDEADETIQHRNVSHVGGRGIEIGLQGALTADITGYASYSLQRSEDEATDVRLTNYPSHLYKAGLFVPLIGPLQLQGRLHYESSRRTVQNTMTDDFLRTDIGLLLATTHRLSGRVTARLEVNNVFDVDYSAPGGVELAQAAIQQDGRQVFLRLEIRD
ncbi:MAG: TonB-dependent receptor [Gemmatimonadetes bacterium]|jgi:iron complex outermembrane receptor protein|nr:TonB-dependent receptor [Gemmatimonadota bacterium]MBT5143083.1 TonB-dependent receptor [Gemmatimonadota bacterium]MBT5588348.1 TonB-dependent receptor [Gemmatimonadota bacterium]MBT5963508.1 TonB-dependent receptor [Gemmatimonadota bacterium]MBT6630584.1 TonB-dependent receptor [Gemmatimonadota bacterium]